MQHEFLKHTNCKIPDCAICSGLVKICLTCNSTSPRLTSDCCGIPLSQNQLRRIHEGTLDYHKGRWIDSRNGSLIEDCVNIPVGFVTKPHAGKQWVHVGHHMASDQTRHHHFAQLVTGKFLGDKQGYKMLRYMPELGKIAPEIAENEPESGTTN